MAARAKLRRPAKKVPAAEPVDVDELTDALLRTIVEGFGDRPLTVQTLERAVAFVLLEAKQAALFGGGSTEMPKPRKRN